MDSIQEIVEGAAGLETLTDSVANLEIQEQPNPEEVSAEMFINLVDKIVDLRKSHLYSDNAVACLVDMVQTFNKVKSPDHINKLNVLVDSMVAKSGDAHLKALFQQHLQQSAVAARQATYENQELIAELRQQISEIESQFHEQLYQLYSSSTLPTLETISQQANIGSSNIPQRRHSRV